MPIRLILLAFDIGWHRAGGVLHELIVNQFPVPPQFEERKIILRHQTRKESHAALVGTKSPEYVKTLVG